MQMILFIEEELGEEYDDQVLADNLEELTEFVRDPKNGYDIRTFMAVNKLSDHIGLETQRDRDFHLIYKSVLDARDEARDQASVLSDEVDKAHREIDKARKEVKKARKEAINSKMELVAILSIFSAIVIAFSGGLNFLGGTISSSGTADIYDTAASVIMCGIMLFNIIAFLMYMVLAIVRLHEDDEDRRSWKDIFSYTGSHFIVGFNIALIISLAVVLYMS